MAEISDSLESDYVSQHFNELLAIGFDARSLATQAMLKPSAPFVIGNVPMLREHGYTADQLSVLIEPRQVVDNIKTFMLEGLSPALAITYVMQVNRCPQQAAEEYIARQLDLAA